jgi:hypothetical protein
MYKEGISILAIDINWDAAKKVGKMYKRYCKEAKKKTNGFTVGIFND